ncbi:AAA family ATPase [Glaciecola siphonariae]|uniref:DNA-directed DNA polymerase n=1 Tax=Glaciecola siphonariae TaxID=521012 RepID=A0ABV9LUH7_9ALTE
MLYPWLLTTFTKLAERLAQDKLHHGVLLVGEKGCGESQLAHTLAKRILCASDAVLPCGSCKPCLLFQAQSHPDFHEVLTEKTQIGVDAVRAAIEQVNKTAQMSANKVVLIEHIETMSESASNALLKTLEEPTNHTYLILTTNAPQYLLATIKSRCEKIRAVMPSYQQSVDYLMEQAVDKQAVALPTELELAAYKHSPLLFLAKSNSSDMSFSEFETDFTSLLDKVESAESIAAKWKEQAADVVHWTAQLSLQYFAKGVQQSTDQSRAVVDTQWMKIYDSASHASKKLRQAGLNKVLILSALLAQVHQLD